MTIVKEVLRDYFTKKSNAFLMAINVEGTGETWD